jgi:hypothetical protein
MRRWFRAVLLAAVVIPSPAAAQAPGSSRALANPVSTSGDAFTNISSVRELSNGQVIVSDLMEKKVQLLDLAGGTATQIGREGQGPGEYGFPGELLPLPGDTTLLVDRVNRRFLVILPNGKTGGTIPFPPGGGILDPRAVDRTGRIYFQGSLFGGGPIDPSISTPDSVPILRWDRRRNVTDTVTFLKVPSMAVRTSGGGGSSVGGAIMFRSQPFSPEDTWSAGTDGRVAVARVRDYHVDWFSPTLQRTSGPANKFAPVRVTEADKEALRKQMANGPRMMVSVGGGGGTSTRSAPPPPPPGDMGEPEYPEFKPPFPGRSTWVTPEGQVWVLRSRPASDPVPTLDVFDQRGMMVGQVKLPKDRRVVGFGNGVVYLAHTDQDDLQWLEKYRR